MNMENEKEGMYLWIQSIDTRLSNLNTKMDRFYFVLFGMFILIIVLNTNQIGNIFLMIKAIIGM